MTGIIITACASQAQALSLFTLVVDPPSFNFGALNPDSESAPQTVTLTVNSAIDMEWSITLDAAPLTHSDGVTTFPAGNYRYWFVFNYPGAEVPPFNSDAAIPVSAATIYTASAGEYTITSGTYGIGFKAIANPVQKAGSYTSQINLTLVNNF